MPRTLVVTNDFPPRAGGIQAFVQALVAGQAPDDVVVYAPAWPGAAEFDAGAQFPVVRHPGSLMLPVPGVAGRAKEILRRFDCDRVLFGAAAPLALLAPTLRDAGARRTVALTHGHEAGWALLPGGRAGLRRIGAGLDVLTYLGDYTRRLISAALRPQDRSKLHQLHPGVDPAEFHPGAGGTAVRAELGLTGRPVVVCVSRLVPRKGQDVLIRALPAIRSRVSGAALLIVGDGPYRPKLAQLAGDLAVTDDVVFTGPVSWEKLPACYDAGDVFAMPCRTRRRGLDVEGLGIVFLEASAAGLPVVAGNSGGAPDAVLSGETGLVVDGRSVAAVADAVGGLLEDASQARGMGQCGRDWVAKEWTWELSVERLRELLAG